jgi:hypothetical protein
MSNGNDDGPGGGVYSPPALGPSALDNNGASLSVVFGLAKRVVIVACSALMVLHLHA